MTLYVSYLLKKGKESDDTWANADALFANGLLANE